MTLLQRINQAIAATDKRDPLLEVLKRIKRRAYEIQTQQKGVITEQALQIACKEEHVSLSTGVDGETFVQIQDRKALADYVEGSLIQRKKMLSDDQIRRLLVPYKHMSDKDKVATLVQRYRGRVRPSDVQRIVKERSHY